MIPAVFPWSDSGGAALLPHPEIRRSASPVKIKVFFIKIMFRNIKEG
jgi:hypothetical protein